MDDMDDYKHGSLLIKLKKTVEGLLAGHSAQGVWSTYGGLKRVCLDTEAILCHGLKASQAGSESDGGYWTFIQGLKWLCPSMAAIVHKLTKRKSQGQTTAQSGRDWLQESVQEHSFVKQLDVLIGHQEHLHSFYHAHAFLCQEKYVDAMKICFRAIELNKPALLSDIDPQLLKHPHPHPHAHSHALPAPSTKPQLRHQHSLPQRALLRQGSGHLLTPLDGQRPHSDTVGSSAVGRRREGFQRVSSFGGMGSKHSQLLEVNYPTINGSNLSLSVDPSIGFGVTSSAPLTRPCKSLSEPKSILTPGGFYPPPSSSSSSSSSSSPALSVSSTNSTVLGGDHAHSASSVHTSHTTSGSAYETTRVTTTTLTTGVAKNDLEDSGRLEKDKDGKTWWDGSGEIGCHQTPTSATPVTPCDPNGLLVYDDIVVDPSCRPPDCDVIIPHQEERSGTDSRLLSPNADMDVVEDGDFNEDVVICRRGSGRKGKEDDGGGGSDNDGGGGSIRESADALRDGSNPSNVVNTPSSLTAFSIRSGVCLADNDDCDGDGGGVGGVGGGDNNNDKSKSSPSSSSSSSASNVVNADDGVVVAATAAFCDNNGDDDVVVDAVKCSSSQSQNNNVMVIKSCDENCPDRNRTQNQDGGGFCDTHGDDDGGGGGRVEVCNGLNNARDSVDGSGGGSAGDGSDISRMLMNDSVPTLSTTHSASTGQSFNSNKDVNNGKTNTPLSAAPLSATPLSATLSSATPVASVAISGLHPNVSSSNNSSSLSSATTTTTTTRTTTALPSSSSSSSSPTTAGGVYSNCDDASTNSALDSLNKQQQGVQKLHTSSSNNNTPTTHLTSIANDSNNKPTTHQNNHHHQQQQHSEPNTSNDSSQTTHQHTHHHHHYHHNTTTNTEFIDSPRQRTSLGNIRTPSLSTSAPTTSLLSSTPPHHHHHPHHYHHQQQKHQMDIPISDPLAAPQSSSPTTTHHKQTPASSSASSSRSSTTTTTTNDDEVDASKTSKLSSSASSTGNIYTPPFLEQGSKPQTSGNTQPRSALQHKPGHKRWVSDTSTIQVQRSQSTTPTTTLLQHAKSHAPSTANKRADAAPDRSRRISTGTSSYQYGTLTKPQEGQSLISYLISQDFKTCANMEKENAHFHISEALIAAFESMQWNQTVKKNEADMRTAATSSSTSRTSSGSSGSSSSSDEEIKELRQRIRIRRREKKMEKGHNYSSVSDDADGGTPQGLSPPGSVTPQGIGSEDDEEHKEFDVALSTADDNASGKGPGEITPTNLQAMASKGLNLSMASLYSETEIQKSNLQAQQKSISQQEEASLTAGSAESVAISLLKKFSEKNLPKASELKWLVSERDAPQRLLPLPASIPVSPDDADNTPTTAQTRLRGNLEWAPPRAQIIFSIHSSEKRSVVLARQNHRCAGCGTRLDPAFAKRYRYCEYLGKYFCQCCYGTETSIIPGRVIERWDFARYPISNFSFHLLEKMWAEPLFHVDNINPNLYKRVRGLEAIRDGRQQLIHLHALLVVCKRDTKLLNDIRGLPSHWIENDNVYSMEDFVFVKTGQMLTTIKALVNTARQHVAECQLCQGLGFICGMCKDNRVIFPFQLNKVVKCPVCQSCYHKHCFVAGKCPKCIRMEARRKQQQQPLSPMSPQSSPEWNGAKSTKKDDDKADTGGDDNNTLGDTPKKRVNEDDDDDDDTLTVIVQEQQQQPYTSHVVGDKKAAPTDDKAVAADSDSDKDNAKEPPLQV